MDHCTMGKGASQCPDMGGTVPDKAGAADKAPAKAKEKSK
jgi:hypothetical protein